MKKNILVIILLVSLIGSIGWYVGNYFAWFNNTPVPLNQSAHDFTIEEVASGLFVPWSIVFTNTERMLVTERSGSIRVIEHNILLPAPLHTFTEVSTTSEEGLMGMALDPQYDTNKYIYVCLAYDTGNGLADKVVRLTDQGTSLADPIIILDNIPAAKYHAGCRIQFGPDAKLYITTGDATSKDIAQDLASLGGKILRINADGSIPEDNPFPNSVVYSYGHRNPQGITWHPVSNVLISTEHGPSLNDGPAGGDEINRIEAGKNYGWPLVSHDDTKPGLTTALMQFTPAVAPGSALIYSGEKFPDWYGNLFFGALKGEGIIRVVFNDESATAIESYDRLNIQVGRIREVAQGPDGYMYFATSNQDGRGELQPGDDKIYRIVPSK